MAADILIVDDEADIRELICRHSAGRRLRNPPGAQQRCGTRGDRRPAAFAHRPRHLAAGLEARRPRSPDASIRERHPELPVVIISGHGNIETAVSAIKRGAYDYIEKPFKADRLILVVGRALEASRLRRENEELKGRAGADTELLGNPSRCGNCARRSRRSRLPTAAC